MIAGKFSDYAQWFMFAPGLVIALASGDLLVGVSGYVPVWLFQAHIGADEGKRRLTLKTAATKLRDVSIINFVRQAMNDKLTLRMERALIEQAKAYGQAHGKSLSRIVADYFETLGTQESDSELSPRVRRLLGVAKSVPDEEVGYERHLTDKYLGPESR